MAYKYISESELDIYRKLVDLYSETSEKRYFMNKDDRHALVVLSKIFRLSKDNIRIFAGNLCRTVGNQPEYITSLSDFIEHDGCVRILLTDFEPHLAEVSDLYSRLAYYISKGKDISVKTTTEREFRSFGTDEYQVHFTVGDEESFREEYNVEERAALCCMHDPDKSKYLCKLFDRKFNSPAANSVDLLRMFGYGGYVR